MVEIRAKSVIMISRGGSGAPSESRITARRTVSALFGCKSVNLVLLE